MEEEDVYIEEMKEQQGYRRRMRRRKNSWGRSRRKEKGAVGGIEK